ncbi:hypothetical protein ACFSHQ_16160 [Gemmobacter lanyuensis]
MGQQDMAEVDYDPHTHGYDPVYGAAPAPHSRKWVNVAGALVSVAMLLGAGVWGYRIAVRDVMGIPVIKAMEGPMRVAPKIRVVRSRRIRACRSMMLRLWALPPLARRDRPCAPAA